MNIERFKRAIEIIEATPEKQIGLQVWQRSCRDLHFEYAYSKEATTCGTIACAAGWLALDPEMNAQGLTAGYGGEPRYKVDGGFYYSFAALDKFFDLPRLESDLLFGSRTGSEESSELATLSDKEIWLRRARIFLDAYEGNI